MSTATQLVSVQGRIKVIRKKIDDLAIHGYDKIPAKTNDERYAKFKAQSRKLDSEYKELVRKQWALFDKQKAERKASAKRRY